MGRNPKGRDDKVRHVTERQDNLDRREPEIATYQQAINLVQQGTDVNRLMSDCGLARNEAELIHLMHQQQSSQHPAFRRLSA